MKISNRRCSRNATFLLPLFSWADARDRWHDAPGGVHVLAHRYRLTPIRAFLIAELAGLGGE